MSQNKQKAKAKSKTLSTTVLDSEEDSEHELFYYADNRIKLMKEVLKLIKPKRIKAIAPAFMKDFDVEELNSMLLEELLGISNKRLKHILNGDSVDVESSSSESEEEKPIDVISLDDISDTDDEFGLGSVNVDKKETSMKDRKEKEKHKKKVPKPIKEEKTETSNKKKTNSLSDKGNSETESDKLMSVLEILELQARARAIRSQLALENVNKKQSERFAARNIKQEESDDSDAVVLDNPKNEEIVITSSESENDDGTSRNKVEDSSQSCSKQNANRDKILNKVKKQKIKIIRDHRKGDGNPETVSQETSTSASDLKQTEEQALGKTGTEKTEDDRENAGGSDRNKLINPELNSVEKIDVQGATTIELEDVSQDKMPDKSDSENDDVVINLDIEEMEND